MVVDYAVTVMVDGEGVSTEQLDYLNLQSNRVENLYRIHVERHTAVHTVTEAKATESLHNTEPERGTIMDYTALLSSLSSTQTCHHYSCLVT